jgi:hypothetical protein
MRGRRLAITTGTPSMTTLPQGTWAPCTATIGTTTTPGPVRTWAAWAASNDTAQGGRERVAAMPQPPGRVEQKPAPILLGVDHEHPTGADGQVINIGRAAGDGQVMQDGPLVLLQPAKEPGSAPLSPTAPRRQATASRLGRNRSPQPAAMATSAPTAKPSRGATK